MIAIKVEMLWRWDKFGMLGGCEFWLRSGVLLFCEEVDEPEMKRRNMEVDSIQNKNVG